MEASAPAAPHIEPEPPEWQPRAIWVGGRLLCGAISFFFASFLFAFFYLKALDVNHNWKIGTVVPDGGIGVAIVALFVFSAVIYRLAARRPIRRLDGGRDRRRRHGARCGGAPVHRVRGPRLRRLPAAAMPRCSSAGRRRTRSWRWWGCTGSRSRWQACGGCGERAGCARPKCPPVRPRCSAAGIEASSFYWAFFVAIGVLAYILLYLVG